MKKNEPTEIKTKHRSISIYDCTAVFHSICEYLHFLICVGAIALTLFLSSRIIEENSDIESLKYAVKYNKRGLFIKENEVEICGNKAFVYLVLDPERRGREISNAVSKFDENDKNSKSILDFTNCGKMVLLSSKKLDTNDVIPLYYTRQIAERMFGIAKDDLGILPLRVHSEPNFKGFMMLVFISLILSCAVKSRLGKKLSTEKAFSILKNLKCKVYNNSVVPNEVNKKQRIVFEDSNVMMSKICGI